MTPDVISYRSGGVGDGVQLPCRPAEGFPIGQSQFLSGDNRHPFGDHPHDSGV